MMWLALAAGVPACACTLWLARLDGGRRAMWRWLPAAPLGIGASGLLWSGLMTLPFPSTRWLVVVDLVIWIAAAYAASRVVARPPAAIAPDASVESASTATDERSRRVLVAWSAAILAAAAASAVVFFVAFSAVTPHGEWDAWGIWNLRARFFFRGYPSHWRDAFSPALYWFKPDYPWLLPAANARLWSYLNQDAVAAPIATAALFLLGTVGLAVSSAAATRSPHRALLVGAALLASPALVTYSAWQFADVPLAFYVLTTFVLLEAAIRPGARPAWWAASGLSAGLAAWTKNEGLPFAIVALILVVAAARSQGRAGERWRRHVIWFLCGAGPALAALAIFKLTLAPPNDLVAGESAAHLRAVVMDASRYRLVLTAMAAELWHGRAAAIGVLPIVVVYSVITGAWRSAGQARRMGLAAAASMLAVYAMTYVLTPQPLAWHLETSLSRVLTHIFPLVVWALM